MWVAKKAFIPSTWASYWPKCNFYKEPIPILSGRPKPNYLEHIHNDIILPVHSSGANVLEKNIWQLLQTVKDPEVPVLSVVELGIIRSVECPESNLEKAEIPVTITITPTYSGCPAMDVIAISIRFALLQDGYKNTHIQTVLSPAWTTDWMTNEGKEKLKAYGIAPPHPKQSVCATDPFQKEEAIQCPRCNSYHTQMISQFGSTACKALYRCLDCKEPFDYFKCH